MKGPVVVIDAANGVGRAIVQAALAERRPVVAVSQDADELRRLRQHEATMNGLDFEPAGYALSTIHGSIDDEASSAALAAKLRALDRPIAGIVLANCSEPARGRVLDQPAAELQRRLEIDLLPQLAAARHLLPVLAEGGRNGGYVLIGSPGSEQPWAGYGYRSIAAAAISMLVRVLHIEARPLGVRVQMLGITRPVRTEENRDTACEGWPAAAAIAEQALALVDHADPRQAANPIVRFPWRAPEPAPAAPAFVESEPEPIPNAVLEQTWGALEPLLRRREDRRK
jgi:NAD(P)-dependent dehydrogenase (short-subunit alcohol dehydrogenase family)